MLCEMKSKEDKAKICAQLLKLLRMTHDQEALVGLEYHKDEQTYDETVVAKYKSGREQKINVTTDSGIALIRDVVRVLR